MKVDFPTPTNYSGSETVGNVQSQTTSTFNVQYLTDLQSWEIETLGQQFYKIHSLRTSEGGKTMKLDVGFII